MAIAYESHAVAEDRNATPLTITKPTGLAEGDLLVAHLVCNEGGGTPVWTLPSGWTSIETVANGSTDNTAVFAKIADSSDVAASDFDFTSAGDSVGILIRLSGDFGSVAGSIYLSSSDTDGTSPSLTGITGDTTYMIFGMLTDALTGPGQFSGWSMATDNPSWAEIYDSRYDDLREIHYGAAISANRASTNDTGTLTYSESVSETTKSIVAIGIKEAVSVTANAGVQTATFSVVSASSITGGAGATPTVNTATFSVLTPSITTSAVNWNFEDRPTASIWTIESQ